MINLKDKSDYFYEIAFLLSGVLQAEHLEKIIPVVHKTFVERYQMISDYSEGKSVAQNSTTMFNKLCHLEKLLFDDNKNRITETTNFKQQHAFEANYGVQDNTMKKSGKRVRKN